MEWLVEHPAAPLPPTPPQVGAQGVRPNLCEVMSVRQKKKKRKVALCRAVAASALLIYVFFFPAAEGKVGCECIHSDSSGALPASVYLHGKAASTSRLGVIKRKTCW